MAWQTFRDSKNLLHKKAYVICVNPYGNKSNSVEVINTLIEDLRYQHLKFHQNFSVFSESSVYKEKDKNKNS